MKKISFIGVGIMGKSMVRNLMKAGFELHIYARTKAKVDNVPAFAPVSPPVTGASRTWNPRFVPSA